MDRVSQSGGVGEIVGVRMMVGLGAVVGTHAGVRLVGSGIAEVWCGVGTTVRSGEAVGSGGQVPPGQALAVVDGSTTAVGASVGQNHAIVVVVG